MDKEEEKLPTEEQTIKELKEQIEKLEKEKEEYLDGWKRAKSDLLVSQKEFEDKAKQIGLFANAQLISDLLAVLDSLDMAIASLQQKDKETSYGRGYYLIQSQIFEILSRYGLEVIDPKGQKFNPNFHEAVDKKICETENCNNADEGLIIDVFSKCYTLHEKLLRPAKIRVITHK